MRQRTLSTLTRALMKTRVKRGKAMVKKRKMMKASTQIKYRLMAKT